MTKLGWTTFVVLPIIILLFGYGVIKYKTNSPNIAGSTNSVNTESSNTGNLSMAEVATSTSYAKASGSYPQFKNASESFNNKIKTAVSVAIEEQFSGSKENWKARFENSTPEENISEIPTEKDKFPISFNTKIIRNDNDIISFVMYIDQYTGGAHGMQSILTFNYDLNNKKEITIDDFVAKYPNFLKKLSDQSRQKLRTMLAKNAQVEESQIDSQMLNDGTESNSQNFSLFTLPTDSSIIFYFTQYQVAAYVFGSSEINFSLPID